VDREGLETVSEWTVPAVVQSVVDGDTLKLDLDLGWGIWLRGVNCRLYGIDTPELSTGRGRDVKRVVQDLVPVGTWVTFVSHELDKYGRPLGTVYLPPPLPGGVKVNLAAFLISGGYGNAYFGGKR
jgi:endonuclease YncB( thermonuclease family)